MLPLYQALYSVASFCFCCLQIFAIGDTKKKESVHTKTSSATSKQLIVQFKQTHNSKRNQEHRCQKYV